LNKGAWVPDAKKQLQPPEFVVFENLNPLWKPNPFLISKIRFKPPLVEVLAKEAGIDPGALNLLKKLGLTSEPELKARLGIRDEVAHVEQQLHSHVASGEATIHNVASSQSVPTSITRDGESQSGSGVRTGQNSVAGYQSVESAGSTDNSPYAVRRTGSKAAKAS
jgi:hypothetical protein